MIVRISGEGQYRLADDQEAALNDLDDATVVAVEAGDAFAFRRAFETMLELVRSAGQALAVDELTESDLIMPPTDISLAEAEREFTGEGLIPN